MKKYLTYFLIMVLIVTSSSSLRCIKSVHAKNGRYTDCVWWRLKNKSGFSKPYYDENDDFDDDEPHYGWDMGEFEIDGFTTQHEDVCGEPIFIKNRGDKVTLKFNLQQDINKLNGDENLKVVKLNNTTDKIFQIPKKNYGKGMLIVNSYDWNTNKMNNVIYKIFLSKKNSKETIEFNEEGRYRVALDYRIKRDGFLFFDETADYCTGIEFTVRNGNTMVFPKEKETDKDLTNKASTEHGFYLDYAGSKDLEVNVKRQIINEDGNEWTTLSNRPAEDKEEFTEDGLYNIKVTNRTTDADPTYFDIYVGKDDILSNFAQNKTITAEELSQLDFAGMNDEQYNEIIKEQAYNSILNEIDTTKYFISDFQTTYINQEYLKELEYNSQENLFFSTTLSDIKKLEKETGEQIVLSTDENGKTILTTVDDGENEENTILNKVIKDVAIGAGVILVAATVASVTSASAPAVSVVCAVGAKGGLIGALSSSAIGSAFSGITSYMKSKDKDKALDDALLGAGEGFKTGAIVGTITGGLKGFAGLKTGAKGGLKLNDVARIQQESKWSPDIIKQISTMDEYEVYKNSNLIEKTINGRKTLIPANMKDIIADGDNLAKVQAGNAPLDANGNPYQLHHMLQKDDGALAVLSDAQHKKIPIIDGKESEIDRDAFATFRKKYWKEIGELFENGELL